MNRNYYIQTIRHNKCVHSNNYVLCYSDDEDGTMQLLLMAL